MSTIPLWGYPVMVLYALIADAYTGWLRCFSLGRMLREMLEEAGAEVRLFFRRPLPKAPPQAYREWKEAKGYTVMRDENGIMSMPSGHTIDSFGDAFVALTSANAKMAITSPLSTSYDVEYVDGVNLYGSGDRTYVSPPCIWAEGRCEMCYMPRKERDPTWGARKFCSEGCKGKWHLAYEKHCRKR